MIKLLLLENTSQNIADTIDKDELIDYYYSHMPSDTMKHFNMPSMYILNTVLKKLGIQKMTPSEITTLQFQLISDEENKARSQKIAQSHTGQKRSDIARQHMSDAQKKIDHTNFAKAGEKTRFTKGSIPWNAGKVGAQRWVDGQAERRLNTMRQNHSFNKSQPEETYYTELCSTYGSDNVIRQYRDSRYPYACDFYIPSEDLFIEVNKSWTHGGHPFDENNPEDVAKREWLKEMSKTSAYYRNALYTWTDLDVRKQQTAKDNNLNYKTIY